MKWMPSPPIGRSLIGLLVPVDPALAIANRFMKLAGA
jgi:hypothetical protein